MNSPSNLFVPMINVGVLPVPDSSSAAPASASNYSYSKDKLNDTEGNDTDGDLTTSFDVYWIVLCQTIWHFLWLFKNCLRLVTRPKSYFKKKATWVFSPKKNFGAQQRREEKQLDTQCTPPCLVFLRVTSRGDTHTGAMVFPAGHRYVFGVCFKYR